jgi:DnaJ-class molecular chaperone
MPQEREGQAAPRACTVRKGAGKKAVTRRDQVIIDRQSSTCPDCGGRGSFIDQPCCACGARDFPVSGAAGNFASASPSRFPRA